MIMKRNDARIIAAAYRKEQSALAAQVRNTLRHIWSQAIDPAVFAASWDEIAPDLAHVIRTHYEASAASAAVFYTMARTVAGLGPWPVPGVQLDNDRLDTSMRVTGFASFWNAVTGGAEEDDAADSALSSLEGSATRLTLAGGRETITGASEADRACLGWERIVSAGACEFCAGLAGEGKGSDFPAHDHCGCTAQPVFG